MSNKYVIINEQLIKSDKAFISIKERGFLFGDGVFETCKIYDGIIYNWKFHLERLLLALTETEISYDITKLTNLSYRLINKNNLLFGIIRIYISRGQGSKGYCPTNETDPLLLIETRDNISQSLNFVELCVSNYEKISLNSLPVNCKLSQSLQSTLIKLESKKKKYFDGIILNSKKEICETSSHNIFWVRGNILYTPDEKCGLVRGSIRDRIISLSPLKVIFVRAKLSSLIFADEVFITNISGLFSVKEICYEKNNFFFDYMFSFILKTKFFIKLANLLQINYFYQKTKFSNKYYFLFRDLLNQDIKNYVKKENIHQMDPSYRSK